MTSLQFPMKNNMDRLLRKLKSPIQTPIYEKPQTILLNRKLNRKAVQFQQPNSYQSSSPNSVSKIQKSTNCASKCSQQLNPQSCQKGEITDQENCVSFTRKNKVIQLIPKIIKIKSERSKSINEQVKTKPNNLVVQQTKFLRQKKDKILRQQDRGILQSLKKLEMQRPCINKINILSQQDENNEFDYNMISPIRLRHKSLLNILQEFQSPLMSTNSMFDSPESLSVIPQSSPAKIQTGCFQSELPTEINKIQGFQSELPTEINIRKRRSRLDRGEGNQQK